ncbi:MAG: hypothetical protein JW867_04460 [Candidatus Omnitrophica bacterium]|nr:hypothetical protein [Candidatus Omnitrophota bacterium]
MIPKLNSYGYLPAGIHKASLKEVGKRFGESTQKRKDLFKMLEALVELLSRHAENIESFLLDGSFVTSKAEPGDFDCVLILKEGFDFNSPDAEKIRNAKRIYNAHLFSVMENDIIMRRNRINFFGHDRDGVSKGLLEVRL